MAAKQTINLTTLFESVIHYEPVIQDHDLAKSYDENHALYALSEDNEEYALKGVEVRALGNRSQAWSEAVQKTYSSPTNLRRAVLTTSTCVLQYYVAPFKNGYQEKTTMQRFSVETAFKHKISAGVSLDDAIKDHMRTWNKDAAYNKSNFRVTGSILKAFLTPWVASNIEEIIFDARLLYTDEFMADKGKVSITEDLVKGIIFKDMLYGNSVASSLSEINKQFPRLKRIAYTVDLSEKIKGLSDGDTAFDKLSEKVPLVTIEFPAASVTDTGAITVRSYYKFDKEVLSEYNRRAQREIEMNKERAKEEERKQQELARKEAEAEQQRLEASKSAFEKRLDEIESKIGLDATRSIAEILKYAHQITDPSDNIQSIMTDNGWAKYFQ